MTPFPGEADLPERLPKLCGLDAELGNFVVGPGVAGGTGYEAARALIEEFDGLPGDRCTASTTCACSDCLARRRLEPAPGWGTAGAHGARTGVAASPDREPGYGRRDWNRRFLASNGGCAYVDLGHLELCIPEVVSAFDHVACWHAMLRLARGALVRANRKQPPGRRIVVLVNNSDGHGNSYGSHLNFLVTREAWDRLFHRKVQHMLFLAAYQASSIVFTGQGKVGSENGSAPVPYQISQRADFVECLSGSETTFHRPIVNTRDEPLCGRRAAGMARLHVIFFDNTLCPVASLLKVGVTQIVLAMIEAGRVDVSLLLDDPVDAVRRWSHDPTLGARARLCGGGEWTAVELQLRFLEHGRAFVASGGCEGIVPRAREILALWEDTLHRLAARDFAALAPRLDWVLKRSVLERARQQGALDWDHPSIKHLDLGYSNLDAASGLFWACRRAGRVEEVVDEAGIERFTREPPEDTRAWTRAMLLRRAGPGRVLDVDWDRLRLRPGAGSFEWAPERTMALPDPLGGTKRESEAIFGAHEDLGEVLDRLEAVHAVATWEARTRRATIAQATPTSARAEETETEP